MITQVDNQSWSKELVTGNAQFIELGSTIYLVSQVRADNTFAVFKSEPTPPQPGPGSVFDVKDSYTFATVNGKNNTSFDPVVSYDSNSQIIYIVGTQDNPDGKNIDVLLFAYDTTSDTLWTPVTLVTASYIRDSYDISTLASSQMIVVGMTNPSQIWQTPTIVPISGLNAISISNGVVTVGANNAFVTGQQVTFSGLQAATLLNGETVTIINSSGTQFTATSTTQANYTQQGYESGYVTWLPGHSLIAMEMNGQDIVGITLLDSSPFRSGNTFGAVNTYSPDGYAIETYYESHPKQVTFADQLFSVNQINRFPTVVAQEGRTVPISYPYTVIADQAGFLYDSGVTYQSGGNFSAVSSSPNQGQYVVSDGTYTFSAADAGALVYLNYATIPLVWGAKSVLKTFTGRYADNRITMIPKGVTRTLVQQYFSQLVHKNALIGNLLLGHYDGTVWKFHIQPGSTTSSYVQGTLSVAGTVGTFVSYLAEPVYSVRGAWSPEVKLYYINDRTTYNGVDYILNTAIPYPYVGGWVSGHSYALGTVVKLALSTSPITYKYYTASVNVSVSLISPDLDTVNWTATATPDVDSRFTLAPTSWPLYTSILDTSTFNMTDVPGFYNTLNFSWLRGSKTVIDDLSKWAVVGERVGSTTSGATYVSDFDVPPVVSLVPEGSTVVLRGIPFLFDASGTNDGDLDAVEFTWTYTPTDPNVSITPNASGTQADLLVLGSIGGAARDFVVGVAAVDYYQTTPLHPPMNIVNIDVTSNLLTITTDAVVVLAVGEQVFLYNIQNATFLNDTVVVVTEVGSESFSAALTTPDYPTTADTGSAIANAQFGYCAVTVPYNPPPTITFTENPVSVERNSVAYIQPVYTGATDADDLTTYTWAQVGGTAVPVSQILSGTNTSFLQFETNGALIQGESLEWSLTVNDGVNPPVTATVTVNVAGFVFNLLDTFRLTRSIWGGTGLALLQDQEYTGYGYQSPTSLSFGKYTQAGSLVVIFESNNDGENTTKTFGGHPVTNSVGGENWGLDYIQNAPSASTVNGFVSVTDTGVNQTPDWVIAEFSNIFNTHDQSVVANTGQPATLTTTNTSGNAALIIATVHLPNYTDGALIGNPPDGWITLLYNTTQLGTWPGAAAGVFYRIVETVNTPVSFQWPTDPTLIGSGQMVTSLTSFNSSSPLGATISQRNSAQTWTPLDVSSIYTNFKNIKRSSVLDGTDRYLLIAQGSVCVYGGVVPNMILLRKLFAPNNNEIIDAVHTEDDWTLVLDKTQSVYKYGVAPQINTDNPLVKIDLTAVTSMVFNKVFTTYSFNNVRVLILTGPDGCLLLQLNNATLAITGFQEITIETGLLYGIDNVQFVRFSNVESLKTGKLLIGTIVPVSASIASISISDNTVTVVAPNTFTAGQLVTFENLTRATFLNGVSTLVVSATLGQFIVSFEYGDYAVTPEGSGAIATTGGKTYETFIDLSHGQIIGTWDASKLRNQFVTTGEILFETNDGYAGQPAPPVLSPIVNQGMIATLPGYVSLAITWNSSRPDLIQSYNVQSSFDNQNWATNTVNSGYIQQITLPEPIGQQLYFRVQAISLDGQSGYSNVKAIHT